MTLPTVVRDEYSTPFFDGAKRGELVMPQCVNGHFMAATQGYGGPVVRCHECLSNDISWNAVSGNGSLVSWTVVHFRDQDPRTAGIVELDEGPWLKALILGSDLHAGASMTVEFVESGDGEGELIPAFRPS